jgi:hypothetical protein
VHNLTSLRTRGLLLASAFLPVAASALPVRASDVLRHCGQPTAEGIRISEVTGGMERELWYGDNILHFEATEGDWEFSSAWKGHLPISGRALATGMPCLREAIDEAAAVPTGLNFAKLDHESRPEELSRGLGIPFFWLIAGLTVVLLFVVLDPLISPETREKSAPLPEIERAFRRPVVSWPVIDRRKNTASPPPNKLESQNVPRGTFVVNIPSAASAPSLNRSISSHV